MMVQRNIILTDRQTDRQTDRRDHFIDFAKGISIILVLWGHCIQYMSTGAFDFFDDNIFKVISG